MPHNVAKEVKIAYDSFIENREVLSWNIVISSKMSKPASGGFQCRNCEFKHELQHFVIDHIEMNHLPNFPGYRCTLCKLVFQTWFIFKNHVNKVHCSNISLNSVKSSSQAPVPVRLVQPPPPQLLRKALDTVSSWSMVRNPADQRINYQCKSCQFLHPEKAVMLKHCEETHSPAREHFTNELADMEDYTCETCSSVLPNQTTYIEHKRRAHKQIVKPYKCELCEYRCLRRARLIHHLAAKHNLYSGQRKTRSDRARPRTELTQQPNRGFQCTKCPYQGQSSAELKVHEYKHHFLTRTQPDCVINGVPVYLEPKQEPGWGRPKFHCRYCLRSSPSQEALTDHEMTHGGKHQYHCEFCNKGFRQRIRWIQHMDKHHGVTAVQVSPVKRGIFTCQYCERDFPFKKTLNEHMISEHGFSRQSKELLPEQFRIENVKTEHFDKNESWPKEEAVTHPAQPQSDNFVAMETDDLMDDASLDDDDIEATLAENIVDYGIFAPDPLNVEDPTLCPQDSIKTEKVEEQVEEGEIIRKADGGFVENYQENKVLTAVKSILKAEFEEHYDDKSSSSLS